MILEPIAPKLPFGMLWRSVAMGVMATNLVPARPGEFVRAYALTRETDRVKFSAALATIAMDRVLDAVAVLLLLLGAMLLPSFPSGALSAGGTKIGSYIVVGILICAAGLGGLYAIVFFPALVVGVYDWLTRRVPPRLRDRGRGALVAFTEGLAALRSPSRFAAVLASSLIQWIVNGIAFWLAFLAVGIHAGLGAALFLQGLIAMGVAAPSSPGFVGVFESLARIGLPIYGVPTSLAVAWAIGFHIFTFIPITVIGLWYFIRMGLHFRDLKTKE
jgi:hypothetical protein